MLNLHVHSQFLVLDGVYAPGKDGESLVFHPSPTPTHTHPLPDTDTPLHLLSVLALLVPPPFYPLLRYHGVLAPNSKLRSRVVRMSTGRKSGAKPLMPCVEPMSTPQSVSQPNSHAETALPSPATAAPPAASGSVTSSETLATLASTLLAATTSRLSRFEWAALLRRIYNVDALACPTCNGRLDFIAVLTESEPIQTILTHLGLPFAAPILARARDPTSTDFSQPFNAHP